MRPGFGGGWVVSEARFLSDDQVAALRATALRRAESSGWSRRSAVKEWIVLEIALGTGLRLSEIAGLACGDLSIRPDGGSLVVRRGKGGKARLVKFGAELARNLERFLHWKSRQDEPSGPQDVLIASPCRADGTSPRALQKMFARVAGAAGVRGHRFHDLRHTHASYLYRASGHNLRLVQKQLGHSSVATTQVYADVLDDETEKAVNALYVQPALMRSQPPHADGDAASRAPSPGVRTTP